MLTLYHHPFCPFSRFVRVALAEYGLVPRLIEERPWERRTEFLALNPAGTTPVLLRPGGLALEEIEQAVGHPIPSAHDDDAHPKSPGMLTRHYAPRALLRLDAVSAEPGETLLGFGPNAPTGTANLSRNGDLEEAAANLFAMLHRLDETATRIAVMPIPERGLGRAINDRLSRAAKRDEDR